MSLAQFHEVSLPLSLAFGAQGGPERRTEIVTLANGQEVRNTRWAGSRRSWDLGGAVSKLGSLRELLDFFESRRGQFHGFRFRDLIDDRTSPPGQAVSATDTVIGTGDGVLDTFSLTKTYGDSVRRIFKPVAGSVRVALDGVETAAGVAVSTTEGTVRFSEPPIPGTVVTAGFVFDVPVRFGTDRLDVTLESFGAGRAVQVPIVELLG